MPDTSVAQEITDAGAELTTLVPLADCYIHALNTRTEPPSAEIEALAESIADLGLLQNLAGWIDPASPADAAWKVGIVAGGRRLRALQLLAARAGDDPQAVKVPVKLAGDEATARLWASAENTARQALHPADEVRAYGRMQRAGADPNTIARAFAVSERHVRQRLKLASLPVTVLAALREGQISLDQAAALTAGRSSQAIEAMLENVLTSRWNVSAGEIRRNLQQSSIGTNDRRVKLIGLDAYRAAGGELLEDLFSDSVQLLDEDLLNQLVEARMAEAVEAEKQRGWKWVEIITDVSERYSVSAGMDEVHRVPVDLPEADAAELEDLEDRAHSEELSEQELDRMNELEARAAGDYPDDAIAESGVWLYLGYQGEIEIFGPYRPRARGEDTPADETAAPQSKAPPQSLLEDLARIRLAALQHRAAGQTELMLDLLAWQMSGEIAPYYRTLHMAPALINVTPEKADGFDLPDALVDPDHGREASTAEGFAAFRALGKKHRNELLTRGLARTLDATVHGLGPHLAASLRPNPREIWSPTAAGYFSRLPVAHLDAIWRELVPADRFDPADFEKLKKAEKAKALDQLFNSADYREALHLSREQNNRIDAWLPEQLQWPAQEGES